MTPATAARRTLRRYASGLALAYLLTAVEVIAVASVLGDQPQDGMHALLGTETLVTTVTLVILGAAAVAAGGAANVRSALRWYAAGRRPDARQQRAARQLVRRQSVIMVATWTISGLVMLIPLHAGVGQAVLVGMAIVFGAPIAVFTSLLFTQRTLRPIVAAASLDFADLEAAPSVLTRLVTAWVLTTALPSASIVGLIVCRVNGWFIAPSDSVELPVVVICLIAVFVGVRTVMLVSRSISDPVREVVEAMTEVEHGRMDQVVDVYERSEIGLLQSGFNQMMLGLRERDRLGDLFGRHVGTAVARHALDADQTLAGDVREVAVLFIDLVGSTRLATIHRPEEVAGVLNDFFRIVVAAVDERRGLINKFQGDAALAVFGAPIPLAGSASAALATGRALGVELRRLPLVDFGIGISAGPVFAGNIGAENRYEYTVIGDAVNEAARLADRAKDTDGRVLCSADALTRADLDEQRHWRGCGSAVLRGRSDPTVMSAPVH